MRGGFRIMDVDRHVLEPVALWQEYLPPQMREYAPRLAPFGPPRPWSSGSIAWASTRSYNRWRGDFCRSAPERLLGPALLSRHDPEATAGDPEDLLQEVFLALHHHILENGFVANLPGMLHALTDGKVLNHVRAQKRSPFSIGLPSWGSEKPRSQPNVERALHVQEVAPRVSSHLSPEHQEVIDKVVLKGLTHADAAEVLGCLREP